MSTWQVTRDHVDSADCWCEPRRLERPNGDVIWIHGGSPLTDEEAIALVEEAKEGDDEAGS